MTGRFPDAIDTSDSDSDSASADDIDIVPITGARLADLDELLARGDPRTCQCAWMRLTNAEFAPMSPDDRRSIHHAAIVAAEADGRAAGLLAYRDGAAVGWVSFGPRDEFERLAASPARRADDDLAAWSVVCFVVAARARRHGVAGRLLDAAIDYGLAHGAPMLEGYPVITGRRSNDLWRGTVGMFQRSGFTTVEVRSRPNSPARPIMRRDLHHRQSPRRSPR